MKQQDKVYRALKEGAATSSELAVILRMNPKLVSAICSNLIHQGRLTVIGRFHQSRGHASRIMGYVEMYKESK